MQNKEQDIANRTDLAARHFAKREFAAADAASRAILEIVPDHIESLNLIGLIAVQLGAHDLAARYFKGVLQCDPGHPTARDSLDAILRMTVGARSSQAGETPKFLVIEAWENGFWSDMSHVLGCLLLAEITGRTPVTHWGSSSLFSDGSIADAFRLYFKAVSPVDFDQLPLEGATFFPSKWSEADLRAPVKGKTTAARVPGLHYLNRPETIAVSDFFVGVIHLLPWIPTTHELFGRPIAEVYRWLAAKYLHPRDALLTEIEAFHRDHISGRPTIAVHFRGLDKGIEVGRMMPNFRNYFDVLDRAAPSWRIFLLSDDSRAIAAFRERYGERVIFTQCQRGCGDIGIHYGQSPDRVRLGREVMLDVYLALRCDKFFGMGWSNVSSVIAMLKPWAPGTCGLQGPCILLHRLI